MANLFRFDAYEDVFCEDGRYLYACREPFGWPHLLTVREYSLIGPEIIAGTYSGADAEYLSGLERAPREACAAIIGSESRRAAELSGFDAEGARDYAASKLCEYGLKVL